MMVMTTLYISFKELDIAVEFVYQQFSFCLLSFRVSKCLFSFIFAHCISFIYCVQSFSIKSERETTKNLNQKETKLRVREKRDNND